LLTNGTISHKAAAMYSFDERKKSHTVQSRVRRLLDLTVPNFADQLQSERLEERYNRTLPALLCAWENDQPVTDSCVYVVTKDVASEGVGILLQQPFRADKVMLAFWLDHTEAREPWFFVGVGRNLRKIGAGFFTMGVQLTDFVGSGCYGNRAPLAPLMKQLLPPAATPV